MNNYSGSKCPKCERTSFEVANDIPTGSTYKLLFVRCSFCKTVVGVRDFINTGILIKNLAKALGVNPDSLM